MCMSVPYGNKQSGDTWRLLRQVPGFLVLLTRIIIGGLWRRLRAG